MQFAMVFPDELNFQSHWVNNLYKFLKQIPIGPLPFLEYTSRDLEVLGRIYEFCLRPGKMSKSLNKCHNLDIKY